MGLYFQSLCSGSSGNCLLVRTSSTRVLIDCGLRSMQRTRRHLGAHLGEAGNADAVVFTHMHSDHCSFYPLRVLAEHGLSIRVHESSIEQMRELHCGRDLFGQLSTRTFTDRAFDVGDIKFRPFEVAHNPRFPTYGFVIEHGPKRIVIATDFSRWSDVLEHFVDADFIFVESNHDPELLRRNYNPNSRFHMPNPETGRLLCGARRNSCRPPQAVMIGHLSEQRNDADIAVREIAGSFRRAGLEMDFRLAAAGRLDASEEISIR